MRGATDVIEYYAGYQHVSIHAPHAGRDSRWSCPSCTPCCFNPRAPCGARRGTVQEYLPPRKFQSTRPMRGATCGSRGRIPPTRRFNPRAPCGVRPLPGCRVGASFKFQSTRTEWGATCSSKCPELALGVVSIHAPRVGRDLIDEGVFAQAQVSIHAPHAGRDYRRDGTARDVPVSIHAPRVGRDAWPPFLHLRARGFNPRAPCGARHSCCLCYTRHSPFQSTRPVWGATCSFTSWSGSGRVSIHAPRVGRDCGQVLDILRHPCFNPRAPCGARPFFARSSFNFDEFQSTRPVWGATVLRAAGLRHRRVSIHAPRVGRDN